MFKTATKLTSLITLLTLFGGCTENTETEPKVTTANTAPQIMLLGDETLVLTVNETFIDPGYYAIDAEDGILTSSVAVSGAIDTSSPGTYTLTYSVVDSDNSASNTVSRTIEITAPSDSTGDRGDVIEEPTDPTLSIPTVETFELVGITNNNGLLTLSVLEDGASINLADIHQDKINIVAKTTNDNATGSLHFYFNGPDLTLDRYENNPAFTMAIENTGIDLTSGELSAGEYTLIVTPYEQADKQGKAGTAATITLNIVDQAPSTGSPDAPKLAALDLVAVSDQGDLINVSRFSEGSAQIDLNNLPSNLINFVAITDGDASTGSVAFVFENMDNNSKLIERQENTPIYTAASDAQHIDVTTLPSGNYRITATPYTEDDSSGMEGEPFMVNLTIKGYVEPTVVAVDDHYTVEANTTFDSGSDQAVGINDKFDNSTATFVLTEEPSNGTLTLDISGLFTYEPAPDFFGSDAFTYEIRQGNEVSTATASLYVTPPAGSGTGGENPGNGGFTAISPSADSKLIYVSSSTGKDSSNCLSPAAPCRSIAAGLEKMRSGYPDHVYLKRGDVWRDQSLKGIVSGRSPNEPAVIAYYGASGPRPKIESVQHVFLADKASNNISNVNFIGLHLSAYKLDTSHPAFTGAHGDKSKFVLLGKNTHILIEDTKFDYLELVLQGWTTGNPSDITLRRNIFTGAYYDRSSYDNVGRPSNLFAASVVNLTIEDNVFDHGGWHESVPGAGANQYNHNIYIQYGTDGKTLVVRNNIITRGSSLGIHGRAGGLFENNFFARNGIGLQMGYGGHPLAAGVPATAINNVVTEGRSQYKGSSACSGTGLCTPALWGINIEELGQGKFTLKNNIVSNGFVPEDTRDGLYRVGFLAHKVTDESKVTYQNNISWKWGTDKFTTTETYPDPNRNLASYNAHIGGANDFDAFMDVVLNRPLGYWDATYSAPQINDYIRAGFGM